jgi:hypothetical protein
VFAYSSRTEKPICTKLGMIIHWDEEENIGGSKFRKSVLSSILGKGVFCSSESNHDIRMVPRQNLFDSERRLQEVRSQILKLSWVRVLVKIFGLGIIFSTIFNDMWPSWWHKKWHIRTQDDSPDDRRRDADTRCHFFADEPRNSTRQDAEKSTPTDVTTDSVYV